MGSDRFLTLRKFVLLKDEDRGISSIPRRTRYRNLVEEGRVQELQFRGNDNADRLCTLIQTRFEQLRQSNDVQSRYVQSVQQLYIVSVKHACKIKTVT